MIKNNIILNEDLDAIYKNLNNKIKFKNSTILITGCDGFIGFYLRNFFLKFFKILKIKKLILVDLFPRGVPKNYAKKNINVIIRKLDVTKNTSKLLKIIQDSDYIIHAASNASPIMYRKKPISTIEANIIGLFNIFKMIINKKKKIKGMLFFSTSEIYGDPTQSNIPTNETYNGNVATTGPRANYDESKRLGETICWIYGTKYKIPVVVVRPFNNFGPGMKIDDGRLPSDIASSIVNNKNIILYSSGAPTRTYCYISDAIMGYLQCLLYGNFEIFNIGNDKPELSVKEFCKKFIKISKKTHNYNKKLVFKKNKDPEYLSFNPNRRCPDLSKAKKILKYKNFIDIDTGISRYLKFLKQYNEY